MPSHTGKIHFKNLLQTSSGPRILILDNLEDYVFVNAAEVKEARCIGHFYEITISLIHPRNERILRISSTKGWTVEN